MQNWEGERCLDRLRGAPHFTEWLAQRFCLLTPETGSQGFNASYYCWSLSCVRLFATPVDCSTPGSSVLHDLPEFTQTHVHWVGDAIQPSHSLLPPSPPTFSLSQHQSLFPLIRLFTSDGQSVGASPSASILPMNIQGWFPLGLTGLLSFQSKGSSGVFSSTTVWKLG